MISTSLQRALALLLLVGLVFLLVLAGPVPYFTRVAAKQDEIAGYHLQLARHKRIREQATLIRGLAEPDQGPIYRRLLFPTQPAPLASAEVQRLVTDLFRANRIPGGSFNPLPERDEQGFTRFGLRASFQASVHQLMDLLKAFAEDPRYLALDNLRIQVPGNLSEDAEPMLVIQLEVSALMEAPNG